MLDIHQAAQLLGLGVTADHFHARIRRKSLKAQMDSDGVWRISLSELHQVQQQEESCPTCSLAVTSYVIVKYHHHQRVEFTLCDDCADATEKAYSKQGGVLEVVSYPVLSEGWMKP